MGLSYAEYIHQYVLKYADGEFTAQDVVRWMSVRHRILPSVTEAAWILRAMLDIQHYKRDGKLRFRLKRR